MEEFTRYRRVGMDRKTGRKFISSRRLPSGEVIERAYRTREDPFAQDWPLIKEMLD